MKLSIIGGTGPQGKGLALRFAMAGFEVALGSRDKTRAIEVAHSLSSENPTLGFPLGVRPLSQLDNYSCHSDYYPIQLAR